MRITSSNSLLSNGRMYRCVLGKTGVLTKKFEGDGATPSGVFPLIRVLYRPDRMDFPETHLPVFALSPNDGWCDDPAHEDYNKPIKLPHAGSHERLWRDDNIYDIVVVLAYNTSPVIPFMGSAIFIHFAEPSFKSTRGCIALKDVDLLEILKTCSTNTNLHVVEL